LSIAIGFVVEQPSAASVAAIREALSAAALERGWPTSTRDGGILEIKPPDPCEPIRVPARPETQLVVSSKTQLAGPAVHLELRKVFAALSTIESRLQVVDDAEGLEGVKLDRAFRETHRLVIQRARYLGGQAFVWLPDGLLADILSNPEAARRAHYLFAIKAVGIVILFFVLLIGGMFAWASYRGLL
jgi:hypothetical protein